MRKTSLLSACASNIFMWPYQLSQHRDEFEEFGALTGRKAYFVVTWGNQSCGTILPAFCAAPVSFLGVTLLLNRVSLLFAVQFYALRNQAIVSPVESSQILRVFVGRNSPFFQLPATSDHIEQHTRSTVACSEPAWEDRCARPGERRDRMCNLLHPSLVFGKARILLRTIDLASTLGSNRREVGQGTGRSARRQSVVISCGWICLGTAISQPLLVGGTRPGLRAWQNLSGGQYYHAYSSGGVMPTSPSAINTTRSQMLLL
jgi:hypothetical protein